MIPALPVRADGVADRLLAWRDRLLTSPAFRRWATAFPLTRPIARRRARALFDLCAGFVYSQILLSAVRLRLFPILAEGPQTLPVLARRLDLPPERAERLLKACVALDLASRRSGGRYGLGPLGAALVDEPGLTGMIEHHAILYADLADPVALLRAGQADTGLGRYWAYDGHSPDAMAAYSRLMAATQPMIAAEILGTYDMRRHRCLLDLGGGHGAFLAAAAQAAPSLRLVLFDLPPVAQAATAHFAALGLQDRATAVGGDLFEDALPDGADIVSLVRVIHDHDDERALAILRQAATALPSGGTLLLAEPMAGTAGAEAIGDAYFGFYLMAMGRGRPRTVAELGRMLEQAGFRRPRQIATATPMLTSLIVAERC